MEQYIYKDKIYICGKISDVSKWIKELSTQFKTVKELLDHYMPSEHL